MDNLCSAGWYGSSKSFKVIDFATNRRASDSLATYGAIQMCFDSLIN